MNATYTQALSLLNGRATKKIDNNTYARAENDNVYVRLHNTDIVTVAPDGTITLDSGGWKTPTTKDRIGAILHKIGSAYRVLQEKGTWYVGKDWRDKSFVFADGMTIQGDKVQGAGNVKDSERTQKQIKDYVKGFLDALFAGKIKTPGAGDCWMCSMRTQDGATLGDATGDDHIQTHFQEKYYVPSLLWNATQFKPVSNIVQDGLARLTQGETLDAWQVSITRDQVQSSLTRYLKHQLGIAA